MPQIPSNEAWHDYVATEPAPPAEPQRGSGRVASGSPDSLTRDEWDEIYYDCESNAEGEPRGICRYAYEAGWKARGKV